MLPSTSSPLHLLHALFSTTLTFPLLTQSLTIFSFPPALSLSSPPPPPPPFFPSSLSIKNACLFSPCSVLQIYFGPVPVSTAECAWWLSPSPHSPPPLPPSLLPLSTGLNHFLPGHLLLSLLITSSLPVGQFQPRPTYAPSSFLFTSSPCPSTRPSTPGHLAGVFSVRFRPPCWGSSVAECEDSVGEVARGLLPLCNYNYLSCPSNSGASTHVHAPTHPYKDSCEVGRMFESFTLNRNTLTPLLLPSILLHSTSVANTGRIKKRE